MRGTLLTISNRAPPFFSKMLSRIKKRARGLPPFVLCVTTMHVPETRIDELPLEVADVITEAKRVGALQTLPPLPLDRR